MGRNNQGKYYFSAREKYIWRLNKVVRHLQEQLQQSESQERRGGTLEVKGKKWRRKMGTRALLKNNIKLEFWESSRL